MAMQDADVTKLLKQWAEGDLGAGQQVTPLVYDTLRRLAERYMGGEHSGPRTLQATALVHEAYIRLVDQRHPDWQSRSHFFGVAAKLMRQILVDGARRRRSLKRGGEEIRVELDGGNEPAAPGRGADVLALHDGLEELAKFDARKSQVIELRYFGGLSEAETAECVGISVATVRREMRAAEAWLYAYMNPGEGRRDV